MKKSTLLFICFFYSSLFFAQDQLFKKDNAKLDVKILEVTPTEIKYKLSSNIEGPLYIIPKNEVALIIYKNGDHEAFKDEKPAQQLQAYTFVPYSNGIDSFLIKEKIKKTKHFEEMTKTKNVVFINSLGFLNSCVSLAYLREFYNGLISVHVPVSFSYDRPNMENILLTGNNDYGGWIQNYKIAQKSIDVGLGLYIHTSGKRAVTHFIGPLFRFVQYNGTFQTYIYNSNGYSGYSSILGTSQHGFVLNETLCMLNNGILFRITPQFNMMINAAIGFTNNKRYVANDPKNFIDSNTGYVYSYSYNNTPVFNFGFNLGYRF